MWVVVRVALEQIHPRTTRSLVLLQPDPGFSRRLDDALAGSPHRSGLRFLSLLVQSERSLEQFSDLFSRTVF